MLRASDGSGSGEATASVRTDQGAFSISVEHHAHRAVVRVSGDVDLASAGGVSIVLGDVPGDVTLDLTRVPFVDSTGIRVLVSAHQRLSAQGWTLWLRDLQPQVLRALQVTGADTLLQIEE